MLDTSDVVMNSNEINIFHVDIRPLSNPHRKEPALFHRLCINVLTNRLE
jgi:hypothetical protein